MSVVFFDTSALLKLFLDEPGRDLVDDLWAGCDLATASRLGGVEVRAGLASAHRDGRLDAETWSECLGEWGRLDGMIWPIELTSTLASAAGVLAAEHRLSGADAVHFASALSLRAYDLVVAVFDQRLRQACLDAGLAVAG